MRGGLPPRASLRRVLVRGPNWLGDTVMAVPTLVALRGALPGAELWGVGRWMPAIVGDQGLLDRCLGTPPDLATRLAEGRRLRREGFDLALVLTGSFETALWARVAGARWRMGYRGDGRAWLLTHALPPADQPVHQVLAYLRLLEPLGIETPAAPPPPALAVRPEARAVAAGLLREVGLDPETPPVGIQLGAAFGPSKLWRPERLAGLARGLEAGGVPVVFLGTGEARSLLAAVASALGGSPRHLVGRDSPALLPALLSGLGVLVAPDSGPAHVAAAVGTPVVTLFGPTDPRLTAPRGPASTAIWRRPVCAPCFQPRCPIDHRCLDAIGVDDVRAAVLERLRGTGGPGPGPGGRPGA